MARRIDDLAEAVSRREDQPPSPIPIRPRLAPEWPRKTHTKTVVVAFAIVAVAAFALLGFALQSAGLLPKPTNPTDAVENSADTRLQDAWYAARYAVRQRMKSPGSAEFGTQTPRQCVTDLGGETYQVRGWVDAKNVYGVLFYIVKRRSEICTSTTSCFDYYLVTVE